MRKYLLLGISLIFLILLLGVLSPYIPGPSQVDQVYVDGAQLSKPEIRGESTYLDRPACYHALAGIHRLESGQRLVIVRHQMVDPKWFTYDDEWYEFLSISLPLSMIDKKVMIPSPEVEIAYSRGGQAWFGSCSGEVGVNFRGSIATKKTNAGNLEVSLDISVTAASTVIRARKRTVHLGEKFVVKPATLSQVHDLIPEIYRIIEEKSKNRAS